MDIIYNNSELTIIAAAGEDPNHGLPGVSPRALSQPHGRVGKHFPVSAMEDPLPIISGSKWMTRGWTYQEGLLSRRRLLFTDQQVLFECRGMYCCEALDLPLAALHTKDQQRLKTSFCNGGNMGVFPRQHSLTGWEVIRRIKEYSRRTLANPSDVLNGLMGVLRTLETGPQHIRHCFGVPVLPRPPKRRQPAHDSDDEAQKFHESYEWSPFVGFCMGLCWDVKKPLDRRAGFPSWSWAGWIGNITWGFHEWNWKNVQGDKDLRVQVQLQDGRILSWDEFGQLYESLGPQLSCILHVSAWVTPVQLLGFEPRYVREYPVKVMATVEAASGRPLSWRFNATTYCLTMPSTQCMAVHLAYDRSSMAGDSGGLAMVVLATKPGVYQRVGFGKMASRNLKEPQLEDPNYDEERPIWSNVLPPKVAKLWQEFCLC